MRSHIRQKSGGEGVKIISLAFPHHKKTKEQETDLSNKLHRQVSDTLQVSGGWTVSLRASLCSLHFINVLSNVTRLFLSKADVRSFLLIEVCYIKIHSDFHLWEAHLYV